VLLLEVYHEERDAAMDDMNLAYVNPAIITWGLNRLSLIPENIATPNLPADAIRAWEKGEAHPTETQAETLAAKLKLPYLVLFLSNPPPPEAIPIPDLRTRNTSLLPRPSEDFAEVINDALIRQDWFREFKLRSRATKLSFVGKFTTSDSVIDVAAHMRSVLKVNQEFRSQCKSWVQFLRLFIRHAEAAGILVMKSGVVGQSSQRRLDPEEFQGFALSDPIAPAVFVNDCDTQAAQIFTLAHELAHIWIGETGISNARIANKSLSELKVVERFCNRVAAEFLVPEKSVKVSWQSYLSPSANIQRLVTFFRVSTLVALRRAHDLGHLESNEFHRLIDAEYARLRALEAKRKREQKENKKPQSGEFWATFKLRNSTLLSNAVVADLRSSQTTYSAASAILGVSISTVEKFVHRESLA
jgi:Zn-dependent peptidase ImmA (M78 family)